MSRMTARDTAQTSRAQLEELVTLARQSLPTLPQEDRREFLEALAFKAHVDTAGNVDFDMWLTERLLPYLAPKPEDASTKERAEGAEKSRKQHSRTRPIRG